MYFSSFQFITINQACLKLLHAYALQIGRQNTHFHSIGHKDRLTTSRVVGKGWKLKHVSLNQGGLPGRQEMLEGEW
jgi:hypothetical protein